MFDLLAFHRRPLSSATGLGLVLFFTIAHAAEDKSRRGDSAPIRIFPENHYVEPKTSVVEPKTTHVEPTTTTLTGTATKLEKTSTVMKTISIYDLGVLQFSIHDMFRVNRETGVDSENRKLDLSVLFDFGPEAIANGGDPRNMGNIIVFSVSKRFGKQYLDLVAQGVAPDQARAQVTQHYRDDVAKAYRRTFDEPFPAPASYPIDQTGNLALRTLHDLNPGWLKIGRKVQRVTDLSLVASGKTLSDDELTQRSSTLDGRYYEGFRNMTVFNTHINQVEQIDLLERDSSLATQFNTAFRYEHFLLELRDGHYDPEDDVLKEIRKVYANAQLTP